MVPLRFQNEGKAISADAAIEYFREASRYVKACKKLAVEKTYTVRLIPERPDALWHIAEYKAIFDNPRLWPILWGRNRIVIPKPDLTEPGDKFVVPSLAAGADELRKRRAEACYLVGKEYEKVGQADNGKEYVDAAYMIWPTLDPEKIKDERLPTAEELLAAASPLYMAPPTVQST